MERTSTLERVAAERDVAVQEHSSDWLSQCAYDATIPSYTSQRGEDRILQKLFEVIGTTNRWCVEFGATDGKHYSNTWHWINNHEWSSVQIEASRDVNVNLRNRYRWSYEALQKRYRGNPRVACLNRWVKNDGKNSLDAILASTDLPKVFDLLSIDVDGPDYDIWQSLQNFEPRVVVVEHNKTIPIHREFHSNGGSSLQAFATLGRQKGYELVAANDLNGVFVRQELFPLLGIASNSPVDLWSGQAQYNMSLVCENDGSVHLTGPDKLRWVRGADGTIPGEIRAGRFVRIDDGETSVRVDGQSGLHWYASGYIRHLLYKLGWL